MNNFKLPVMKYRKNNNYFFVKTLKLKGNYLEVAVVVLYSNETWRLEHYQYIQYNYVGG